MDLEVVSQYDQVRAGAEPNPPDVLTAEQGGRALARRGEHIAERGARVGDTPHAVEQLGGRAGDGPVLAAHDSALGDHAHLPEKKFPVTEPRGGRGVAH